MSTEGKKFIMKTLGSILDHDPLFTKLHVGTSLDLIADLSSEL